MLWLHSLSIAARCAFALVRAPSRAVAALATLTSAESRNAIAPPPAPPPAPPEEAVSVAPSGSSKAADAADARLISTRIAALASAFSRSSCRSHRSSPSPSPSPSPSSRSSSSACAADTDCDLAAMALRRFACCERSRKSAISCCSD